MTYRWNGDSMWETVSLPAATGRYLKIAGPLQWQVLLWLATQGRGRGDAAACAAALGGRVSAEECADALSFWVQEGILQVSDETDKTSAVALSSAPQKPLCAAVSVLPKPRVDVAKTSAARSDCTYLLQETSSRLGKALSPHEMEKLVDLLTNRRLPAEVILMAVQVAISRGKRTVGYAVGLANGWADDGIFTLEQVNEQLCRERQLEQAADRLCALIGETVRLTLANKKMAAIWFFDWGLSDELVCLAFDRSREKKAVVGYMNRLLESWHANGLSTAAEVAAYEDPKATKKAPTSSRDGGFDLDKYSAMLEEHTLTYRGKGE